MPKPDELLFALKTFAGAMTALYLAFWLGLENPYWSMATAYIVAQPLTGAMRSKALYRFIGTSIGGTAAVVLVPTLVNAPLLLSLALAVWVGLCLYLSLLDRTPRSYVFMLAGYTAGIIGFPAVSDPAHIFQTALTRVEEITLGIVCVTVIGTVVFPRAMGPVLARRLAGWVKPGVDWATAALHGRTDDDVIAAARQKLAAEAVDVGMMTTQLAFDTSHLQGAVPQVQQFRLHVLSLMPVLSSISDRVAQLRRIGGITPSLQHVLNATADWVKLGGPENADAVEAQIKNLDERDTSWPGLLRASLALRLEELIAIMRHARAIRRHLLDGDPPPPPRAKGGVVAAHTELHDHGMALLSALAAGLAVLLVCAFWIETAWSAGAGAAVIVAVACSFFAAQDDPAPAIALMMRNAVIATIGAGAYVFVILPRIVSFDELALVLAPAAMVIGVLVSRPATFGTGMVMGAFGATSLALGNGYAGNFAGFVNSAIALVLGVGAALIITRLIRSVGAAWSAKRLLRGGWRDITAVAEARAATDRAALSGRMLDRLGLIMPRLAAVAPSADLDAADLLRDLRVGLNLIELNRLLPGLPAAAQRDSTLVMDQVAAHYRGNPLAPAPETLLAAIDRAILDLAPSAPTHREPLMILSGLRSVLFVHAAPPDMAFQPRATEVMPA